MEEMDKYDWIKYYPDTAVTIILSMFAVFMLTVIMSVAFWPIMTVYERLFVFLSCFGSLSILVLALMTEIRESIVIAENFGGLHDGRKDD